MNFLQDLIEALYPHAGGGGYGNDLDTFRGQGSVPEPTDQMYGQANFQPGGPPPSPQPPPPRPMRSGQMQGPPPTPPPGLMAEEEVPPWAKGVAEYEQKPPGYTWEQWRQMLQEAGRLQ